MKVKIISYVTYNMLHIGNMYDFQRKITIQAKNLYFLLNGRLRTTEEQSGSGSLNSSVDYGRGKSVGFVEAYQVGTRNRDTVVKTYLR